MRLRRRSVRSTSIIRICAIIGTMSELIVEYLKWPGTLHYRADMTLLGDDEAGLCNMFVAGANDL